MRYYYILDAAGNPAPCDDLIAWATWMETADRHVGDTTVGETRISTVFLGLDHNHWEGPPILFESMVFLGAGETGTMERYHTRSEALAGHARIVRAVETETQLAHYMTLDTLGAIVAELRAGAKQAPSQAAVSKPKIHHEARPLGAVSARQRRRQHAYMLRAYQRQSGASS